MPYFFSSLKVCLRSGSFKLLLYMGLSALALAVLVSAFSGRQLATLMVDFGFSATRIVLCIASLLWIQELVVKPLESKTIVQSLSYPSAREGFLFSAYFAIIAVITVACFAFSLILAVMSFSFVSYEQDTPINYGLPYVTMWLLMALDLSVVVAFGVFIAVVSRTPYLAVVVALAFYVAGHSIKQMLDLLSIATYIDNVEVFKMLNGFIQYLVPDLSAFDVRHWAIYNEAFSSKDILGRIARAVSYLFLSMASAAFFFRKREIV